MDSRQAELFKILGLESRIRIIKLLKQKGALGVNEISKGLGLTPSAVCQHLKLLKHAGLVKNERRGYWVPYKINPAALEECGQILSQVCTCGCLGAAPRPQAEMADAEDKLASLTRYEMELQKELAEVRRQIEELKKE